MNYNESRIIQFANNSIKVQWIRDDNQKIKVDLTLSDYDFLIRNKNAKLLLKPLTEDVFNNDGVVDSIVDELDIWDAYCQWLDIWQERVWKYKIKYAPFVLVERLIKNGYDVFNWIQSGDALDVNIHSH